jgi:dinuclear metal center YbgI/SA1388 family protein
MTVGDILDALFRWAPAELAWEKDNVGLQVGDRESTVRTVLVTLDVTRETVDEAVRREAQLVVAHHPLFFHPLRTLDTGRESGRVLARLLAHGIAVIAMHTNADAAADGVNTALAERLGLQDIRPLDIPDGRERHYRFVVPGIEPGEVHRRLVDPVNAASVSRELHGTAVTFVAPLWSESALRARMREAFGTVARYEGSTQVRRNSAPFGLGAVGSVDPISEADFIAHVKRTLGCEGLRSTPPRAAGIVRTAAVCGGAGAFLVPRAIAAGADAFVTADVGYHTFLERRDDILVIDAGHFETERVFIDRCAEVIRGACGGETQKIDIFPCFACTNPVRFF